MARRSILMWSAVAVVGVMSAAAQADGLTYIVHISVDGMGYDYDQLLMDAGQLPNLKRFETQGAWTNNARDDYDFTVTLPNHTTQITGRAVDGPEGHNWTGNTDPDPGVTIQSNKCAYVASVFDVAHDNGLRTALYAGKSKFSLFDTSYNAENGAADVTGVDNGRDKIDYYYYNPAGSGAAVVAGAFVTQSTASATQYSFLHFADPDVAGHAAGWGSPTYNAALQAVDDALGTVWSFVDNNPTYRDHTYIVLTADHGGGGNGPDDGGFLADHGDPTKVENYTIPFYVWGPGVAAGVDLYSLNAGTRWNPGTERITYDDPFQPIRNGDAANLELELLGLGPIPGSTINALQDLSVAVPEPASLAIVGFAGVLIFRRGKKKAG
jgi:hypothetical protein